MKSLWNEYREAVLIGFALAILIIIAAGCAQLGVTQIKRAPHTVEEALLIAAKSGDGMTVTFMQLRTNRTITSTQYEAAIKQLQEVHDVTQRGIDAYKTALALCVAHGTPQDKCGFGDAQTALDRADLILQALAAILAEVDTPKNAALFFLKPPPLQNATLIYWTRHVQEIRA